MYVKQRSEAGASLQIDIFNLYVQLLVFLMTLLWQRLLESYDFQWGYIMLIKELLIIIYWPKYMLNIYCSIHMWQHCLYCSYWWEVYIYIYSVS